MKLLNVKELSAQLPRSVWWFTQAKKAGMPFYCGMITLNEAVSWMKENPHFIAKHYISTHLHNGLGRPPSNVGKHGGLSQKHVRRSALPQTSKPQHEPSSLQQ